MFFGSQNILFLSFNYFRVCPVEENKIPDVDLTLRNGKGWNISNSLSSSTSFSTEVEGISLVDVWDEVTLE